MRIILSRKGFDASVGCVPSPILEDGRFLSLPIPRPHGTYRYEELHPDGVGLGQVVHSLTKGRIGPHSRAHFDPDLDRSSARRSPGWVPAFGQADAAASHLRRRGVVPGDIFLFFRWFRRAERVGGRFNYVRGAEDLHVVFGWLRVGRIVEPAGGSVPRGLERHPHFDGRPRRDNIVYVAKSPSDGGVFRHFDERLRLTAPGCSRSRWRLPGWLLPEGRTPLSYHANPKRWRRAGKWVYLDSVGRGQEFVLDTSEYPEAAGWVRRLLGCASSDPP